MIVERVGNLFDVRGEMPLAHAVSADLVMGGGIAATFVHMYPPMKPSLLNAIDKQRIKPPQVGDALSFVDYTSKHTIYNLITKERVWEKPLSHGLPSLHSIRACLESLKEALIRTRQTKVAIPHIGCGLDMMDWRQVLHHIKEVFEDSEITIYIYTLEEEVEKWQE